jgi:hypothetical protein
MPNTEIFTSLFDIGCSMFNINRFSFLPFSTLRVSRSEDPEGIVNPNHNAGCLAGGLMVPFQGDPERTKY